MKIKSAEKRHLWRGQRLSQEELQAHLPQLPNAIEEDLQYHLPTGVLMEACEKLRLRICDGLEPELLEALMATGATQRQADHILCNVATFMEKDHMFSKLKRELGSYFPFDFNRPDYSASHFEAWNPLGVQFHVVSGNALQVAVISLLEGLMAGNINILKNTSRNGLFATLFFQRLIEQDAHGLLQHFIYVFEVSSQEKDIIQHCINLADVICIWGGEEAVKSIRAMTPAGTRIVVWGHKISFAYFTEEMLLRTDEISRLAEDICKRNQQACTSPQCVLVESTNHNDLRIFAEQLVQQLEKVGQAYPVLQPSLAEQAEITAVKVVHETEAALQMGEVYEAGDLSFRVLVDFRPGLRPSPLFRTIWVKPIERKQLTALLRPLNPYLQTCGLAVDHLEDLVEVTRMLLKAGVQRITEVGQQHDAYTGEPHDGVYALQQYTKRVAVRYHSDLTSRIPAFQYIIPENYQRNLEGSPVMDKETRQQQINSSAKIYLKSGGSTGQTKVSGYSWADWRAQVEVMAESFYIGGVQPGDRCAILYSAGNLYGGFITTLMAFERIGATALTIGSNADLETIAENIESLQPNVVLGMPSFLRKLFREQSGRLQQMTCFEKLFYGGELMTVEQQGWFKKEFGFQTISSPVYASNDALMNGYACAYCENGEFHVPTRLMEVEIFKRDEDQPADAREIGRLLVTKKGIKDPELVRYDIGDLARWVGTPCPCGHQTPKFRLMGRSGDLVRCGAKFINYREITNYIVKNFHYTDDIQLIIETQIEGPDRATLRVLPSLAGKEQVIAQSLREAIPDLAFAVKHRHLELVIECCPFSGFEVAQASGKTRPIVDRRN